MPLDLTKPMMIEDPYTTDTIEVFGAVADPVDPHHVDAIAGTIAHTDISFNRNTGWITSATWHGYRVINVEQTSQEELDRQKEEMERIPEWGRF